ncbi:hypothetical protein DM01DRAFT_1337181 [Hesseltinella vesiculosa]|uniref:Uncharacterized protein n=1 Tax=Hesseltinella vesiculosa TaxID=101127 RepID=A0A1X2GE66_9FUNG|nr:hypothetical protein DM01DRAFT_1337181 [Hesseltinella vesiculosa]
MASPPCLRIADQFTKRTDGSYAGIQTENVVIEDRKIDDLKISVCSYTTDSFQSKDEAPEEFDFGHRQPTMNKRSPYQETCLRCRSKPHPTWRRYLPSARRCILFCAFFFIALAALILFFLWPRVPLLRLDHATAIQPAVLQNQTNIHGNLWLENFIFSTQWLINVTADNRGNYLPTCINQVSVIAKDALTGALIGKGQAVSMETQDVPAKLVLQPISFLNLPLAVRINYESRTVQDQTMWNLVQACQSTNANTTITYPLQLIVTVHFCLIDWLGIHPSVLITPATGGFLCPHA